MPWPRLVEKRPLDPSRLRRIGPLGFSWIDRRFVQEGLIERLEPEEVLLYLFLACVADRLGLSWWSDRRISLALKLCPDALDRARARLVERGLIAWRAPLYQVLDLSPAPPPARAPGGPALLGDILRQIGAAPERAGER